MRAAAKARCYLCVWCAEAEHADEKKEKKKKKKEKEEKQQQEACKSKASPSEVETEAATAAQSILEHSVSRPLSRPAEAADASGTAGCSLIADSSKASSLSQDTSQQVQLQLCHVTLSVKAVMSIKAAYLTALVIQCNESYDMKNLTIRWH